MQKYHSFKNMVQNENIIQNRFHHVLTFEYICPNCTYAFLYLNIYYISVELVYYIIKSVTLLFTQNLRHNNVFMTFD